MLPTPFSVPFKSYHTASTKQPTALVSELDDQKGNPMLRDEKFRPQKLNTTPERALAFHQFTPHRFNVDMKLT